MNENNRKRSLEQYNDSHKRFKKNEFEDIQLTLNVRNQAAFNLKFPVFKQPKEIGGFSLDIGRKFENGKKQLKYYVKPANSENVHFDLNKGYSEMIRKDENKKEYLDHMLQWTLQNYDQFSRQRHGSHMPKSDAKSRNLSTDFFCWRGLLTTLLCTPYENREGWMIAVTLYNGTYYLCDFETEQKKQYKANRTDRDDRMCCWGWKFEQYLTSDQLETKPDTETAFNNCDAFCTVVSSKLGAHSLVFAGEVDAIKTDGGEGACSQYVELKTSRHITHPKQLTSFKRYKLIKWWAQSFLVGIPEIICGYRDDDGIVHRLESFKTQKIPEMIKDLYNPWKPNVCFNFLDQFFNFVKKTVKTDDCRVVHLFRWNPDDDITCTKLSADTEFKFLPDWYTS